MPGPITSVSISTTSQSARPLVEHLTTHMWKSVDAQSRIASKCCASEDIYHTYYAAAKNSPVKMGLAPDPGLVTMLRAAPGRW